MTRFKTSCAMHEAVIVPDSSPLIGLARIGQLDILPQLSSRVLVPQFVWEEVTIRGSGAPGSVEVKQATWIEVQVVDPMLVEPFTILVDRGESEAIALARTIPNSLLLLDDSRAWWIAERLGIRRTGTGGLLRRAKEAGLIDRLRPQLEALQANGIWIRRELIDAVLREAGE